MKVLLIVADALRHDLFWRYFRRKDGKVGNVFTAGMGTPVATLAMLYGITPSYVYWPSKVTGDSDFLKTLDVHVIASAVKKVQNISLVKTLEDNGVRTFGIIFNDLVVPAPFSRRFRLCSIDNHIGNAFGTLAPSLIEEFGLELLGSRNPFIRLIEEFVMKFYNCFNFAHVKKNKNVIYRKLREIERYENAFVYLHLLTPHEPYLCRDLFKILEGVKDVIRYARYKRFWQKYVELIRGSHMLSKEESIDRIRKFYERFEELEKILKVNKIVIDAKEAYKACVMEVIEFLDEMREKFGKEWKIIFTSDHPEYFGEGGALQHEYPFPFGKTLRAPIYVHGEYGELGEIYQTRIPEMVSRFFGITFRSKAREKVMEDLRYLGAPILSFYTEEGGPYVRIHSDAGLEFEKGSEKGKRLVMQRIRRAMVFRGTLRLRQAS